MKKAKGYKTFAGFVKNKLKKKFTNHAEGDNALSGHTIVDSDVDEKLALEI